MKALSERERKRRLRAYETSWTDPEAAKRLGLKAHVFADWRHRAGLPADRTPPLPQDARAPGDPGEIAQSASIRLGPLGLPAREQARRLAAYERAATAAEAAKLLGLSLACFQNWRHANRLPPKRRPRVPEEDARRLRAYHETASDEEAARSLNLNLGAFRNWRANHKLPGKKSRRVDDDQRYAILQKHPTPASAARELGITEGGLALWLRHPQRVERTRQLWPQHALTIIRNKRGRNGPKQTGDGTPARFPEPTAALVV